MADIKEIQAIGFEILCDIDSYCKKNNIKYMLSGGTTLGAVREHDFIPWDDDIDIMMPRADFEKFIANYSKECPDKYQVGSLLDETWTRPPVRIWDKTTRISQKHINEQDIGVFVDLFPIDGTPKTTIGRHIFFWHLKFLNILRNATQRKIFLEGEKFITLKKVLGFLCKPLSTRKLALMQNELGKKYKYEDSKIVAVSLALAKWYKECIAKECLDEVIYETFHGKEFPIPKGYHQYLSNLYGEDYMTPKREGDSTHSHLWNVETNKNEKDEA